MGKTDAYLLNTPFLNWRINLCLISIFNLGIKDSTSCGKHLFADKKHPQVPLLDQERQFLSFWNILAKDQKMLSTIKGYTTPFSTYHLCKTIYQEIFSTLGQLRLVDMEVPQMLPGDSELSVSCSEER